MSQSRVGDNSDVGEIHIDKFSEAEDVAMFNQLPFYDEYMGYDASGESEFEAMPNKIYGYVHKHSRGTLRRHLMKVIDP